MIGTFLIVFTLLTFFLQKNLPFVLKLLLNTLILSLLLFPPLFVPRYGFIVIFLLSIFGIQFAMSILQQRRTFITLGIICLIGVTPIVVQNFKTYDWYSSQSNGLDTFRYGQSSVDQKYDLGIDNSVASALVVSWVHKNVMSRDVVCYSSAATYPSSFWNLSRTSLVEYSPIVNSDRYPNKSEINTKYSSQEIDRWLFSNSRCSYLVTSSPVGEFLVSQRNYNLVLEDDKYQISIVEKN